MDKEILKKVCELAEIRYNSYLNEENNGKSVSLMDGIENIEYNAKEEMELLQYLEDLNYEQNLMILTVAYIGRGDCGIEFEENKDTNKIYKNMLNSLKDTFPNKEITILKITEKFPLDDFLKRGFELLKIEI